MKKIGKLFLALGIIAVFAGCKTAPDEEEVQVTLAKIEITNPADKVEYFVGDANIDLTGLKVTATYNNGTKADVTDKITVTGFDSSVAVESQTITVTYEGKTATFTVKIQAILLTGIAVTTQPTKTEYHIGDEIDITGLVITASYNNGSSKSIESSEYTVTGFNSTEYVDNQEITVTYNEKTAIFTIDVVFNWYETPEQLPAGESGTYGTEGTYVYFGVWPQDIVPQDKIESLALNENASTTITRGYMKFVHGSDGGYYVKSAENASAANYKYTDGSTAGQGGTSSRWFKVMPIKWRVVNEIRDDYGNWHTRKVLVAENILTANVPFYESNNGRDGMAPSDYTCSQIRGYLNGIDYKGPDGTKDIWNDKGFLQTAFTENAVNKINTPELVNARYSCTPKNTNYNDYFWYKDLYESFSSVKECNDKIFPLSIREITIISKEDATDYGKENTRIRKPTDYAKANYANQNDDSDLGGDWLLRTYFEDDVVDVRYDGAVLQPIIERGDLGLPVKYCNTADTLSSGIVPALSIDF